MIAVKSPTASKSMRANRILGAKKKVSGIRKSNYKAIVKQKKILIKLVEEGVHQLLELPTPTRVKAERPAKS